MSSPCSFPLGVVCSDHAAEVQALRPTPLALVAGESMKTEGASRRSAAPGSQKVGAAEYGGDLCALQQSWSDRTKDRILGPVAIMRIAASCSPISPSPEGHEPQRPATWKRPEAQEGASHSANWQLSNIRLRYALAHRQLPCSAQSPTAAEHPLLACSNASSVKNGG
jgi:hypothetical protein